MRSALLALIIAATTVGCGSDDVLSPEWRDLVTAFNTPGPYQYERACLEKPDSTDTGDTCRFAHVEGERVGCNGSIMLIEGMRGCCVLAEPNIVRWHECE